jgi:CBS domain-containing membrane protein
MLVRDLMQTEVVTLNADDHLDLADDIMKLGRIRHLPVLADGKLVGILSERDLYRAGISSLLQLKREVQHEWLAKVPVRAVMTTDVVTVAPGDTSRKAVGIMLERKIGCLPVVDKGELVGLLGESDCMRHLARLLEIAEEKEQLPELP